MQKKQNKTKKKQAPCHLVTQFLHLKLTSQLWRKGEVSGRNLESFTDSKKQ